MDSQTTNKTYSSTKGVVLELRPVSQFKIDTLKASKKEVEIPTYEIQVAGGEKILHPLDAEIAKNKGRINDWNAYLEKRKAVEAEHARKFLELLIWEGVMVDVPDCESDWQKQSSYFGIVIPENPIERKLFYVYNELLGTPQDIGDLVSQILSVSQIDEEAVAKLRDSFRAGIQRKADRAVSKKQGKLADGQPDVERSGSGKLLALETE